MGVQGPRELLRLRLASESYQRSVDESRAKISTQRQVASRDANKKATHRDFTQAVMVVVVTTERFPHVESYRGCSKMAPILTTSLKLHTCVDDTAQLHYTARTREACHGPSHPTRAPPKLSHAHCGPHPNEHAVAAILVAWALLYAMTWRRTRGQAKTVIQVAAVLTLALITAQHTDNDTIATCVLAARLTSPTARRLVLTRTSIVLAGAVTV